MIPTGRGGGLSKNPQLPFPKAHTILRCMTWHVQYRKDAIDHIARQSTPEAAIEAACRLIDDGCDVYGIGTGPLTDSIEKEQIARIYAMWDRVRHPFGIRD